MTIDVSKQYKTRDGQEVTELTIFSIGGDWPVRGVIDDVLYSWDMEGIDYHGRSHRDLIEVKPEQWHYIYKTSESPSVFISKSFYESEEKAKGFGRTSCGSHFLGTWKLPEVKGEIE